MSIRQQITTINRFRQKKIIVLDDDPTGVQTVHHIDVLTQWDQDLLREAFHGIEPLFFILTNTRGLDAEQAARINREIARNVQTVAAEMNVEFAFVSRSDSTLRGYYPLETDVLSEEMLAWSGKDYDAHLLIPAFFEGGRLTRDNVHYIKERNELIPVNESEFAKDKVFGFDHADLTKWVQEKTAGRWSAQDCVVLSLELINQGPTAVEEILLSLRGNVPVIVNCLSYEDLDIVSLAVLKAEAKGKNFIFRTAASFVKSYGGISDQDYLPPELLINPNCAVHGGLVVVGSYVQKTTRQLEQLIKQTNIIPVEMNVSKILDPSWQHAELSRLISQVGEYIAKGDNVVLYSSRNLITGDNSSDNLKISQTVSSSLVQVLQSIQYSPKFIIAKGGITSSDIATQGLGIRKAHVIGQAAAGVPVWITGEEAKFVGLPYIVFPGNVGNDDSLATIVLNIEKVKE
jgi:uncharacterized protein YgbK (DUF1537 family)